MKSIAARVLAMVATIGFASAEAYDPLKVPAAEIVSKTFEVKDAGRDRTLPIRVYLPEGKSAAPVVIFSHGLGGSRDNNPYLGNHWARRGYAVVFVQHPGSDESVWKDAPGLEKMTALKEAASIENYLARAKDVPVVIDALAAWNKETGHALAGRLDLERLGMSGHSFGAQTTQALAGQGDRPRLSLVEPRIDAAVMMSPSPPRVGDPAKAFANVKIPCLLMTGTRDESPIGNTTPEDRLKVFPALQQAPAWEVVFDQATHMDFGQRGRAEDTSRYHKAILALTTAFWDAELKGDSEAKAWLNGEGAKSVLVAADRWEANGKAKE
ncbi:alpha/beta hydrolase family protein [Luteolibacter soli]|uniref:Alpha/beta fold hydrolase n=1 Tax=Luteolibacter soli TaxID=3135280 RepID=A0ABU9AWW3_9BACT